MANTINFFCYFLLLGFLCKGNAVEQCYPGKPVVTNEATRKLIKYVRVWNVTVANECSCSYSNVVLSCPGMLESTIPLNSSVVTVSGDLCTINGGAPIYPHTSVSFTYANNKVPIKLSDYQESCS